MPEEEEDVMDREDTYLKSLLEKNRNGRWAGRGAQLGGDSGWY